MSGIAIVKLQGEEYECSSELAEAIDAALEQARRERLYSLADMMLPGGWDDCDGPITVNGLYAELTRHLLAIRERDAEQAHREARAEERERVLGIVNAFKHTMQAPGMWKRLKQAIRDADVDNASDNDAT